MDPIINLAPIDLIFIGAIVSCIGAAAYWKGRYDQYRRDTAEWSAIIDKINEILRDQNTGVSLEVEIGDSQNKEGE